VPATFAGCQRFAVYRAPGDPASFLLYEEWADREAVGAYLTSEYFRAAAAVLFPLIDGQPDSAYYESQRVGP
jgi:quinol monooxygenase YgiN